MYRGDDIYLLDYWPLDNLNTVGAGIYKKQGSVRIEAHIGANRILSAYQYQDFSVPGPYIGAVKVVTLDRQRFISSLKAEYLHFGSTVSWKVKGYGEWHYLPSGTYNALENEEDRLLLPADRGLVLGFQAGAWRDTTFINLFFRYSKGLAAYGEFSTPMGVGFSPDLAPDYTAWNAWDVVGGFSMNLDLGRLGVQAGGYIKWFEDADSESADFDDGVEGVLVVRPYFWIYKGFALGAEFSHQYSDRRGLNPWDDGPAQPRVTKIALIPTWFSGKSTYSRPAIRVFYEMIHLNEDARRLFPPEDVRYGTAVYHVFGVNAEWWFNSSTYR